RAVPVPIPGLAKAARAWSLALHARGPAKIQPPEVLTEVNVKSVWRFEFPFARRSWQEREPFPRSPPAPGRRVFKYSTGSTRPPETRPDCHVRRFERQAKPRMS